MTPAHGCETVTESRSQQGKMLRERAAHRNLRFMLFQKKGVGMRRSVPA